MKVNLVNSTAYLAEVGQLVDIKFAQANIQDGVANAVIPLCKCRDFLLDVVYANHHSDVLPIYSIYGMQYNVKERPLDMSKTVFVVKFENQEQLNNFHNNLGILHRIEEHNKFNTTKVHAADEDQLMIVVEGDAYWCKTTLATNLYTMLIKFCAYSLDKSKDIYQLLSREEWQKGDIYKPVPAEVSYLSTVKQDFFEFLLQDLRNHIDNLNSYVNGEDAKQGIESVHSYSGICSAHRKTTLAVPKSKYFQYLSDAFASFKLESQLFSCGVAS